MERSMQSNTSSGFIQFNELQQLSLGFSSVSCSISEKKKLKPVFKKGVVYQLKNDCTVEIVTDVKEAFSENESLTEDILDKLKLIILKAFEVDIKNGEIFVKGKRFHDLFDHADYLGIIKRKGEIIGFHTGKIITGGLYYAIATMINPEYQSNGVGLTTIMIIFDRLTSKSKNKSMKIITRTRNYMVVRMIESTCTDYSISTEGKKRKNFEKCYQATAAILNHPYESKTGIVKNVYPAGVPRGYKPPKERISKAFKILGPKDGCYVAGEADMRRVRILLERCANKI